jgi:hypothetical protein
MVWQILEGDGDWDTVEETVGDTDRDGDVVNKQDLIQLEPDKAPPSGHVYTGEAG